MLAAPVVKLQSDLLFELAEDKYSPAAAAETATRTTMIITEITFDSPVYSFFFVVDMRRRRCAPYFRRCSTM